MTDNKHNALSFKNEEFLQITFSNFLSNNPSLSIGNALDAFIANFEFFKFRIKQDKKLALKIITHAISNSKSKP